MKRWVVLLMGVGLVFSAGAVARQRGKAFRIVPSIGMPGPRLFLQLGL